MGPGRAFTITTVHGDAIRPGPHIFLLRRRITILQFYTRVPTACDAAVGLVLPTTHTQFPAYLRNNFSSGLQAAKYHGPSRRDNAPKYALLPHVHHTRVLRRQY